MVIFETTLGNITLEFFPEEAPITVENFLTYMDDGHFDSTIFHRAIPEFMVQGGGFTADMNEKATREQIKNEADNGLKNERGTLSMARTQAVDSATSQFFINVNNNKFLDHGERDFGYAVFAKVTDGMDVVDQIAAVPTGNHGSHENVPLEPVVLNTARRVESE
ncbi:MAG: peptidylprolyl isomerase [bacterium]|nr:peptidylprolyl isomerase [bacterium]